MEKQYKSMAQQYDSMGKQYKSMARQYDSMSKQYNAAELAEYVNTHYTDKLHIPRMYTTFTSFMHRSRNDSRSVLNIFIEASKDIEKYASSEKYKFILVEYDYTLHINKDLAPSEYKKCLDANSGSLKLKVKINKPLIGNVYDEHYLALGDKNWLTAEHSIKIEIPVPYREYYTEKEALGVTELLKKCIVIT